MTILDIKNKFETISISHKEIQDFNYGEDVIINDVNNGRLQQVFLEIPVNMDYEQEGNRFKSFTFALNILFPSAGIDGIRDDITAISKCERIGEAIISRFRSETRSDKVRIVDVNGVSVRNVTDADLCGVRYEITITTPTSYCDNDYSDHFN